MAREGGSLYGKTGYFQKIEIQNVPPLEKSCLFLVGFIIWIKKSGICDKFSAAVDAQGDVCISILHEPGEDKYGYERPEERWLPIHTVETILVSVISMLADPNDESPANIDAAVSISN